MRQAVILAGGKGTRLIERLGDLPKPLVDVCGTPLLEHQILLAKRHGIQQIFVLVNHAANKISEFCEARENWGLNIKCIDDGVPRGTAGAVLAVIDQLADDVLTIYGDTMLDVDLSRFWSFHDKDRSAAATIFTHPNDHPHDSDLIETSDDNVVTAFYPYPHDQTRFYPNQVSAALYVLRKEALAFWRAAPTPLDFGKDLFPEMLRAGQRIRSYSSPEYIKDAGTPGRLDKVCADLKSGRIARASLTHPQKAVFLDRDGCINLDHGHIDCPERFELIEGAAAGIKHLNKAEFRTLVVTNQPVVARGDCTFEGLRMIHNKMETELGRSGAFVDKIYFCPHHPDRGFAGEVAQLKRICECRKPATGLIDDGMRAFNVDRATSWMIGDTTSDVLVAKRSGLRSILLETGAGGLDGKYMVLADYSAKSLREAADFIVDVHPRLIEIASDLVADVRPGDVVIVGGLSRSGKSSLSSAISEVLRSRGTESVVISLDRWILPAEARAPGVLGRYDMDAIKEMIERLTRAGSIETHSLPYYEKGSRTSFSDAETVVLPSNAVLVIEGTVALHFLELIPGGRAHAVFVDIDEEVRKKRVVREYILRGMTGDDAAAVYASRQKDEAPIILSSRAKAKHLIQLDAMFEGLENVG
jgi:histidinol-phosphate phosphatase family protein